MVLEAVSTDSLAIGMYVAKLDRPWLETPFLFQGFTIKSEADIAEIRRYCNQVYVEQGGPPPPPAKRAPRHRKPSEPLAGGWQRFIRFMKRRSRVATYPEPGNFYKDTVQAKAELPRAREAYQQTFATFSAAMEQIRGGGKVEVEALRTTVSPMLESLMRNRDAMTWLTRIKQADDYTYGHSVSCAIYAIAFGRHLGLPRNDLHALGLGGLLLDVGKTRIPRELLAKKDKLTDEEARVMREHVRHGEEILKGVVGLDARVMSMVRSHHERYDGSGYPDGLKGPDIPVFARIGGIVDFYHALITPRVYAPIVSAFDATRTLHRGANRDFQAEMVEQFIQAVGVFPTGALIELSTGEVGVVVEQNRVRRLRPKLVLILGADKKPLPEPQLFDLHEHPSEPGERGAVWIDRGLETGAYGINAADYFL